MDIVSFGRSRFSRDLSSQPSDFSKFRQYINKNKKNFKLGFGVLSVFVLTGIAIFSSLIVSRQRSLDNSSAASEIMVENSVDSALAKNDTDKVKVIIRLKPSNEGLSQRKQRLTSLVRSDKIKVVQERQERPYIVAEISREALEILKTQKTDIESIVEDKKPVELLKDARVIVKANEVEALGDSLGQSDLYRGKGTAIAIIDRGVNKNHPYFKDSVTQQSRIIAEACFGGCPNGTNFQEGEGAAVECDPNQFPDTLCDHGTKVSLVAGGFGGIGQNNGIATQSKIIAIRLTGGWSDYIQALIWLNGHKTINYQNTSYSLASINTSLGWPSALIGDCSFSYPDGADVMNELNSAGVVLVAASGNESKTNGLMAPACLPQYVAVGSTDKSDVIANSSNQTSILASKTVLAPGGGVSIPNADGTYYIDAGRGTSFASPEVAGAVALLKSAAGLQISKDQLLQAFQATGALIPDNRPGGNGFNYARIDIAGALGYLSGLTTASVPSFSQGANTNPDNAWTQNDSTLGASTVEGSVLAATPIPGYVPMALVTAAYRSTNSISDGQWISKVTYCGQPMTIIAGKDFNNITNTQGVSMWYLLNPPSGNCQVKATFGKTGGYKNSFVFSSTKFKAVDPSAPFSDQEVKTNATTGGAANTIPAVKAGLKDTVLACGYAANSVSTTTIKPKNIKRQYWSKNYNDTAAPSLGIISSAFGLSEQRKTDGQSMDVGWTTSSTVPWSSVCVNVKVKPAVTPTPTPTPQPTPCSAPLLPRVSTVTRTSTGISWSAVTGAKSYNISINDTASAWSPSICQTGDTCGYNTTNTSYNFSIQPTKTYEYLVLPVNACGNTAIPLPTLIANIYPTQAIKGFSVRYFPNTTFTVDNNGLFASRTDPTIGFNWSTYMTPSMILLSNKFSARWGADILAPKTGTYTFQVTSMDGVRLWVNDKLIINKLTATGVTQTNKGTISLTAGALYKFKLEYYNTSSSPQITVKWIVPGSTLQLIPASAVTPNVQLTF